MPIVKIDRKGKLMQYNYYYFSLLHNYLEVGYKGKVKKIPLIKSDKVYKGKKILKRY